ncbi:MAG: chromate efflux transporter [Anaerolineales bacterium]|nr:MAG: chromate efflux transporter [Anaerolineales bacterium]
MRELVQLCLQLGFTAFGGPAAHIAMLRDEAVTRRGWLTDQHFLDLLGATNLIPGPNSTEMVLHIGYLRRGWPGLLVAGLCFISPAALAVLALAWLYRAYGSLPQAAWLLYGVKPVVIVLILQALWLLGRTAARNLWLALVGVSVFLLYLLGVNEIALLFGAALLVTLAANAGRGLPSAAVLLTPLAALPALPFTLSGLFWTFLKIGSVLYGSGYVLFAFMQAEFVTRLGWLSQQQLIDAIAVGQLTPGPLFTSATFVGYVLGGLPGSLLATIGIFLPSFLLVGLTARWLPRLRQSAWASAFLDGVNIASVGLMAAVAWQLGATALIDLPTIGIAVLTAVLLRSKVNSALLVLGGALAGLLVSLL